MEPSETTSPLEKRRKVDDRNSVSDSSLRVQFDEPPRAVLGCLQIATDFVLDSEAPALIAKFPGVEYRSQKLVLAAEELNADTYHRSANNIVQASAGLAQPQGRCTAVGLSCTSMSFTLGPEKVDNLLHQAVPTAKITDMARAQAIALQVLGASKVALFTPYIESLSVANAAVLKESAGVEVVNRLTMGLDRDELTSLVSLECIRQWVAKVNCDEADAVVIGCSAFRACPPTGFIDELEAMLGKPVVTSTQAFLWAMLRTAGVRDTIVGYGKLFREHADFPSPRS